jgi:hypothetical protein
MMPLITRRNFLVSSIVATGCSALGLSVNAALGGATKTNVDLENYLAPTTLIDSDNPAIMALATRIAPVDLPVTERVSRIFAFVRDEVLFGFGPRFYDYRASQVAEIRRGFCNTKGTLFIALLRASGIPARQVFVDIDAAILEGIVDPGTPYVDHSYTEIFIDNGWIATDAYIVDAKLFSAAQERLASENKSLGYGAHRLGTMLFSSAQATFSQFVAGQVPSLTTRHYGIHADVNAFYEATPQTWNRLTPITRIAFPLFSGSANGRAEALRRSVS